MVRARRPHLLGVLALSLAAAACTGDYSATTSTTSTPPPAPPPNPQPVPPNSPSPGDSDLVLELGGTLAITVDNLVVTASPDGETVELVAGGRDGIASQPVWSPDGSRLAWVHLGPEGESVGVLSEDGEELSSTAEGAPPFYLQWSADGRRLAYLRSTPRSRTNEQGPDGVEVLGAIEAGLIDPGGPAQPLTTGSPFYLSWAPDRLELIALRNEDELLHLSEQGGVLTLPDGGGPYTAPVWSSPETVIVSDSDSIDELNIETGQRRELAQVAGRVRFILSPNKQRLAYNPTSDGVSPSETDTLRILDLNTGEEEVVSQGFILAWEWSPDSQSLAYLAPPSVDDVELVAMQRSRFIWSFWSDGDIERGAPYIPSLVDAREYLPFFEQFVQSHRRWSPTSNAFAFAGSVDGFDGIWIQVVGHADEPVFVTPGDSVTWGPADVSGGGQSVL